jgi:hypothetical protein
LSRPGHRCGMDGADRFFGVVAAVLFLLLLIGVVISLL